MLSCWAERATSVFLGIVFIEVVKADVCTALTDLYSWRKLRHLSCGDFSFFSCWYFRLVGEIISSERRVFGTFRFWLLVFNFSVNAQSAPD